MSYELGVTLRLIYSIAFLDGSVDIVEALGIEIVVVDFSEFSDVNSVAIVIGPELFT
jgi:hypothetical protein